MAPRANKNSASGGKRGCGRGDNGASNPKKRCQPSSDILESPITSPTDKKEYRMIRLHNGLTALLISDHEKDSNPAWAQSTYSADSMKLKTGGCCPFSDYESPYLPEELLMRKKTFTSFAEVIKADVASSMKAEEKAAIALLVKAGGADDPKNCNGLAHFTEHMLHYGSKTYRQEDMYWNFLQSHGKYVNAYTQMHSTVYQFSINPDFLEEAMGIFGNIVQDPLFDEDCAKREVQAVDSEFCLRKHVGILQIFDVLRETVQDDHPLKNFLCGNATTLNSTNLNSRLRDFHKTNYVANKMVFAIQSTESLDFLQQLVEKTMGDIEPGSRLEVDCSKKKLTNPYNNNNNFQKIYKLRGEPTVSIVWQFPPDVGHRSTAKPLYMLSQIMNDGREGSLKHHLYSEGWIHDYFSDSMKSSDAFQNQYACIYLTVLELTQEGEKNIAKVIQAVYAYINVIGDKKYLEERKRLWEELRSLAESNFKYCGNGSPDKNVHFSCRAMMNIQDGSKLFTAESLLTKEFDEDVFQNVIKEINPKKALYVQFVSEFHLRSTQRLKYSEVPYICEAIRQDFCQHHEINSFIFPKVNPYLSKRFRIQEYSQPTQEMDPKLVLVHSMFSNLTIPKAVVVIRLISTEGEKNLLQRQMLNMLSKSVWMNMTGDVGCARRAGMHVDIWSERLFPGFANIIIHVMGYPQFIPAMIRRFCEEFSKNKINKEVFQSIRQSEINDYYEIMNKSSNLMMALKERIALVDHKNVIDTPFTLNKVEQGDLENFTSRFKSSMLMLAVVQGNISTEQAKQIQSILKGVQHHPIAELDSINISDVFFSNPFGERAIRIRLKEPRGTPDGNNVVFNTYEIPKAGDRKMCTIIATLMQGRVFSVLRTREQLGYSLRCVGPMWGKTSISLIICTPYHKYPACYIDSRMDAFLKTFHDDYLSKMTDEECTDTLIKAHLRDYISVDEVKQWYKKNIYDCLPMPENPKFVGLCKMSLQVISPMEKSNSCSNKNCNRCANSEWIDCANPELQIAKGKPGLGQLTSPFPDYFVTDIAALHDKVFR